jgi:hypothetical protein
LTLTPLLLYRKPPHPGKTLENIPEEDIPNGRERRVHAHAYYKGTHSLA